MSEEEYIRNRLDMINRNSVYGLMIDSEITKIVRSHIKRDIGCDYDRLNCPKPPIYIGQIKVKSLKKKIDNYKRRKKEMKATSVQVINNVKDMNVTIERCPLEETRIIISVSTDDDTYEINCSGFGCEKFLRKNDFVHVKEYEYINNQLMDREKEINKLKQQLQQVERDNKRLTGRYTFLDGCYKGLLKDYHQLKDNKEEYEDKIEDLQHKYNLEREANEAQRKFFRKYAGEGVEIEFHCAVGDDEYTYVIVDKEEYKALKNIQNNVKDNGCYSAMIHGKVYNRAQLVDRVLELEELKTPTIENFADEEPSSRRDILRCAEKCVCGKREQDYGTPESNFQLIADLWNGYLGFTDPGDKVKPMDVAMMMGLMKIARIRNGGGSGDSFVDLAGYAACGGEIWHSNQETNGDFN